MSRARESMELRLVRLEDGGLELRAPEVGEVCGVMGSGATLAPGMVAGALLRLGRSYDLVVPAGAGGLVTSEAPGALRHAVGFDERLYALDPSGIADVVGAADAAGSALADGALVVRAAQPGRVWRSASPGEPPVCSEGDALEDGTALCLIEVMKTFSTVPYRATGGLPARAVAQRWLVEDGADVEPGTPLLAIETGS